MSLRSLIQRIFTGNAVVIPSFSKGIDSDLGEFTQDGISSSWFILRQTQEGQIMIRGRSLTPTLEQKKFIDHFIPLLKPLTEASLAMLRQQHDYPEHPVPCRLELRELRFESTGVARLFFDPEINIGGLTLWPMVTCSLDGRLLTTEWVT